MKRKKAQAAESGNGTADAAQLLTAATTLAFGGRDYKLIMSNRALIEFEQLTGMSALMDGEKIFNRPTLHALSAMLYVLLKRDGCLLTLDQVVELLTEDQIQPAYRAILAARVYSFTRKKDAPTHPTTNSPS